MKAADQSRLEMWGGYWNTDDFFKSDADQERLRELAALWKLNPSDAFPGFLALAEAGSVWSMIRVGCGYRNGLGVARDARNAERWFDAAFKLGSDYGLIWSAKLAVIHGDLAKAKTILTVGAERDLPPAILALADLELKGARTGAERERARALYDAAVDKGFPAAEMSLARMMMRGKFGWRRIPEGFRRYKAFVKEAIVVVGERERELLAGDKIQAEEARHVA